MNKNIKAKSIAWFVGGIICFTVSILLFNWTIVEILPLREGVEKFFFALAAVIALVGATLIASWLKILERKWRGFGIFCCIYGILLVLLKWDLLLSVLSNFFQQGSTNMLLSSVWMLGIGITFLFSGIVFVIISLFTPSPHAILAKGLCEKCGANSGSFYIFHYGTKTGETKTSSGRKETVTTTYKIGGSGQVQICRKCRNRKGMMDLIGWNMLFGIGGIILGGLALGGIGVGGIPKIIDNPDIISWMLFGAFIFMVGTIVFVISLLCYLLRGEEYREKHNQKEETGEKLAISLRRNHLEKQGFDSFFTPKKYEKLTKR